MATVLDSNNFIRIHLINKIIQISCKMCKDQRLAIVVGFDEYIELSRQPKFKIYGLKQNGSPITRNKTHIGWYSFTDKEVLQIFHKLKTGKCHLTDDFFYR